MTTSATTGTALDAPDYPRRWQRAREELAAAGFDGAYVTAGPTFTWLSGFTPYPGGWPDFASCLILPLEGEPVMLLSAMHAEIVDRDAASVGRLLTYVDGEDPVPALRQVFADAGLASGRLATEDHIWFSDVELAHEAAPNASLRRSTLYERLRAVKDEAELALLRRSAACQDAAFETAAEAMTAGGDLSDAEVVIRAEMMALGCETIKLLGIFKSPRPRAFVPGELIDIDFGTAVCSGYSIDSSRNVYFGQPSEELLRQWETVVEAYDAAVAAVRPGAVAGDVHRAGAAVVEAAGFRQTWKMGHGVGLSDGHEPPWLQEGSEAIIEEGMTFTIDPGFFLARDLPLHLENTVVVTATGCEQLNRFPNELIVI